MESRLEHALAAEAPSGALSSGAVCTRVFKEALKRPTPIALDSPSQSERARQRPLLPVVARSGLEQLMADYSDSDVEIAAPVAPPVAPPVGAPLGPSVAAPAAPSLAPAAFRLEWRAASFFRANSIRPPEGNEHWHSSPAPAPDRSDLSGRRYRP